jgi:hypothetical protein
MIVAVTESLGTIHKFRSARYWPVTKVSLQMLQCWLGHFWLSSFIPRGTKLSVQLRWHQQCLRRLLSSLNAHLQESQVKQFSRLFTCMWASRWPFCWAHSVHMHGFHPACLSYMPQTCGMINLTVLYYHVASECDEGDDFSDGMTAYTCHRWTVSPPVWDLECTFSVWASVNEWLQTPQV